MHSPAIFSAEGSGVNAADFTTLMQFARRLLSLEGQSAVSTDLPLSDPFLDRWVTSNPSHDSGHLTRGTIVLALPFLHCYLVKGGDREPLTMAAAGTDSSL